MEILLTAIVSVAFAYVARKLEGLEQKVDRLQEEVLFIHLHTKKRESDS